MELLLVVHESSFLPFSFCLCFLQVSSTKEDRISPSCHFQVCISPFFCAVIWAISNNDTICTNSPCDWRRTILLKDSPASAQSRVDSIPHPFFPPGERHTKAATQRRVEGEAGSPLLADRAGNIWQYYPSTHDS